MCLDQPAEANPNLLTSFTSPAPRPFVLPFEAEYLLHGTAARDGDLEVRHQISANKEKKYISEK